MRLLPKLCYMITLRCSKSENNSFFILGKNYIGDLIARVLKGEDYTSWRLSDLIWALKERGGLGMFGVGGGHSGLGAGLRQRYGCGKAHGEQKQQKIETNICLCLEKERVRNSCKDRLDFKLWIFLNTKRVWSFSP